MILTKYNTLQVAGETAIYVPMIKRAVVDFAVGADWTPAAGDVTIKVGTAAVANITNLPTAITFGNTVKWQFILTAAETSAKIIEIAVSDAATKVIEDQSFSVHTFGNASAYFQADLSAANLPANVIQISGDATAADTLELFAEALDQATGQIDNGSFAAGAINAAAIANDAIDTATFAAGTTIPRVTLVDTTTTNTDMRGTDNAALAATALSTVVWTNTLATNIGTTNTTVATNLDATVSSRLASAGYTAPPSAATISTQVASDLAAAHGAGSWLTATGFSTHSAADVITAMGTGAFLSAVPWNAAWDVQVESEVVDGLTAFGAAQQATLISFGAVVLDIVNDTNELQTDWTNGGRLDLLLDSVLTAIAALNNLSAVQVNAEMLDVLSVDTFAELSAPPAATSTLRDKLTWLFMWARNKATESATERKLFADNESTVVSTEAVDDTAGVFTKGEAS